MSSLNEVVDLLEKVFYKFIIYFKNIEMERESLYKELDHKEEILDTFYQFRELTIKKLNNIKNVLKDEVKADLLPPYQKKKESNKINILMVDE